MSKSKGNVVDPLGVIDEYGADALRFTLMRDVAPGHDITLGPQDVENNRNFATKLWNAARFVEMNGAPRVRGLRSEVGEADAQPLDRARNGEGGAEITQAIETYASTKRPAPPIASSGTSICDWYVELSKPLLDRPRWRGQGRDARHGRLGAR